MQKKLKKIAKKTVKNFFLFALIPSQEEVKKNRKKLIQTMTGKARNPKLST